MVFPPSVRSLSSVQVVLYWLFPLALCVWVLSLPVFPSQDGPLHLYYVNALSHLLARDTAAYADLYTVKSLITPYSLYYYGLLGLGHCVGLEWADKILVCIYLIGFAACARYFLLTAVPSNGWTSFLVLPVLLNWPLLMGFLSYSLSTCFALAALSVWMRFRRQPTFRLGGIYLLLIAAMMITHPLPWLYVVAYAALDLCIDMVRQFHSRLPTLPGHLRRRELGLFLSSLLPAPYVLHFNGMVQSLDPEKPLQSSLIRFVPAFAVRALLRASGITRTFGIAIFGGHGLAARLYRGGIAVLFFGCFIFCIVQLNEARKLKVWRTADTWAVFSLVSLPFFLFAPDKIANHFFFMSRLGILLFLSAVAGASHALMRYKRFSVWTRSFSYGFAIFSLVLAIAFISPVAKAIASLRDAPTANGEGLLMQPIGNLPTVGLNYLPFYWASAHYFREHDLLMYNTAWLGDPILLIGVKNAANIPHDGTFYEAVPQLGSPLLPNDDRSLAIFQRVSFLMLMQDNAPPNEAPLTASPSSSLPMYFATHWDCEPGGNHAWYLCRRSHDSTVR